MTKQERMTVFGWIATILCAVCTINAIVALNHNNYFGGVILLAGSWIDGIVSLIAYDRAEKRS